MELVTKNFTAVIQITVGLFFFKANFKDSGRIPSVQTRNALINLFKEKI